MSAEVLARRTTSGEYPEYGFNAVGDCCWVLFHPPNVGDWVGVFGSARWGAEACVVNWPLERAFVIAKGRGYIVNTTTHEVVVVTKGDRFQEVIFVDARGVFVAADGLCFHVFDPNGQMWASPRISWDGIRRLGAAGAVVSAEASALSATGDAWSSVTLDLDTKAVTGATYYEPDAANRQPAT